jgi:hypothetical protein
MALSPADQIRLDKLRCARDELISGKATAAFEYNGMRTEYAKANVGEVNAEIAKLEAQASRPGTSERPRGGAIRFRL